MKEEIARDRAEREARAKEKASCASTASKPIVPAPQKHYDTCRLQVKYVSILATSLWWSFPQALCFVLQLECDPAVTLYASDLIPWYSILCLKIL